MKITAIQTGRVKVKSAQVRRKSGGPLRVLIDRAWTDWLPIFAWVIEHPEGLIVVDSGETSRVHGRGYHPGWHPYYRSAVRFDVPADQKIGPRLLALGIEPRDVATVVLTHLHTDHAGGLSHFPSSRVLVEPGELRAASGLAGRLRGYLLNRWPDGFSPDPIRFEPARLGPYDRSLPVTKAGDVVVVPTPGHTAHHVSVIARSAGVNYFLAGDVSYAEDQILERRVDGVGPDARVALETLDRVLHDVTTEPTVYLPSHDPGSGDRLRHVRKTVPPNAEISFVTWRMPGPEAHKP